MHSANLPYHSILCTSNTCIFSDLCHMYILCKIAICPLNVQLYLFLHWEWSNYPVSIPGICIIKYYMMICKTKDALATLGWHALLGPPNSTKGRHERGCGVRTCLRINYVCNFTTLGTYTRKNSCMLVGFKKVYFYRLHDSCFVSESALVGRECEIMKPC